MERVKFNVAASMFIHVKLTCEFSPIIIDLDIACIIFLTCAFIRTSHVTSYVVLSSNEQRRIHRYQIEDRSRANEPQVHNTDRAIVETVRSLYKYRVYI